MASKGKKITLLDSTGMLSKEALLGYVYNELSPAVREEVEGYLAQNEMYRDMVEGMQQVPDRAHAEKVIHALNVDIAERSGSTASVPGLSENVGDFFWNYRRVAAAVGSVLLVSAAVFVFALMQVSDNKKEVVSTDERQRKSNEPPPGLVPPAQTETRISADSTVPLAELEAPEESSEAANGSGLAGGTFSITIDSDAEDKDANALSKAKKPGKDATDKSTVTGAGAIDLDTISNQLTVSEWAKLSKESEKKEEITVEDNDVYYGTGHMMNSSMDNTVYKSMPGNTSSKGADSYYEFIPRTTAEQMPAFPGGNEAFVRYLHDNLKYPKDSREKGTEGKVYLNFTIGTTGKVKDITIITGVNKEINAEAIRLISSMPKWEPGKDKGEIVPVMLYHTIEFKIPPAVQEKK